MNLLGGSGGKANKNKNDGLLEEELRVGSKLRPITNRQVPLANSLASVGKSSDEAS